MYFRIYARTNAEDWRIEKLWIWITLKNYIDGNKKRERRGKSIRFSDVCQNFGTMRIGANESGGGFERSMLNTRNKGSFKERQREMKREIESG